MVAVDKGHEEEGFNNKFTHSHMVANSQGFFFLLLIKCTRQE